MATLRSPRQVKDLACAAWAHRDRELALEVVREIAERDLYIQVPKPEPTQQPRAIIARWGIRPCRAACGGIIHPGEKVWWEPNWGVSHLACVGKSALAEGDLELEPEPELPLAPEQV